MKKVSFVLAVALMLAACGTESDSKDSSTTSEPEVEETEVAESSEEKSSTKKENTKTEKQEDKGEFYAETLNEEIPLLTEEQGTLSQESYDFIVNNSILIPAHTQEGIEQAKSKSEYVDIKLLNKNIASYYGKLVTFEGYVVQIEEETFENGETAAWLNIYDDFSESNFLVYMYKTTGDILEEDYVQFWGLPITKYSYETLDGGFQNAILFFGSHVERIGI